MQLEYSTAVKRGRRRRANPMKAEEEEKTLLSSSAFSFCFITQVVTFHLQILQKCGTKDLFFSDFSFDNWPESAINDIRILL